MKKLLLFLAIINLTFLITQFANAQAPPAIPYQAVARDNAGSPLANQNISLRFSIHDSTAAGTVVYRETHSPTTNLLGLFTVKIGEGTVDSGAFLLIDWGAGSKFMQVEMDVAGGTSYTDMGTQQMLSVPFALNSATSSDNKWMAATGNNIRNSNSGNVGIGTFSPTGALHIIGSQSKDELVIGENFWQLNDATNRVMMGYSKGSSLIRIGQSATQFLTFGWIRNIDTTQAYAHISTADVYRPLVLQRDGGNVGIGTTSPAANLDVTGTVKITDGTQGLNKVLTSDANGLASWQTPSGGSGLGGGTANYLPKWNSGTSLSSTSLIYDDGTNVGIGTTTPSSRLHVNGNIKITDGSEGLNKVLTSDADGVATWQELPAPIEELSGGTDNFVPRWSSSTSLSSTSLIYDDGNNVGIGTASPYWKFTVQTNSGMYGLVHTDGNTVIGTYVDSLAGYIGTQSNHPLAFFTFGNNPQMKLTLDGNAEFNGNVGIGMTAPSARLHVNGNVKITDGTEGLNKVLTSDADGLASWNAVTSANILDGTIVNADIANVGAGKITSGTLVVARGGTGAATLTGYVKGTGTTAMTASPTIPGTDITGNIAGNAVNITGTVAVPNGGTGATTLTGYVKGNGTSTMTAASTIPGADVTGNITGNAVNVTGTVAVPNGGTGATTLTGYVKGNGTSTMTASSTIPGTDVTGNISGNAAGFTGSLAGNVTGTQGATVVATVGGVTAANVASGANAANASTNSNTNNTIVKRDATGNFSADTITATLNGHALTATNVTGTVAAINGGTGQSSYTAGDLLYASSASALSKLADVATGNALISGGAGVAPVYGKIGLTTHVSGILPVANGGTGTSTALTPGSIPFAGASGNFGQNNSNLFWDNTNNRLGIGTNAPASKLDVEGGIAIGSGYAGTTAAPTNGAIIEGNVGIGTDTAFSKLDVEGGVSIGSSYSGTTAAPSNGAIIQGKVGIGTSNPLTQFHVKGGVVFEPTGTGLTITSDNETMTVGNESYIRIVSNSIVGTDRSVVLSDGLIVGQILFIENTSASGRYEFLDDAAGHNTNTTGTLPMLPGHLVQFIWNGSTWLQVTYSAN